MSEVVASGLVYAGFAAALFGALNLVRPLRRLGVHRGRAAVVAAAGIIVCLVGFAWPASERAVTQPASRLDGVLPRFEFAERHAIRVHASPADVDRAIRQVTAAEIRLFRTLTWIRHPRWPGAHAPESLLAPAAGKPILETALRSGFLTLADEPQHELVVGAVVCCAPEDARRLLPRLRSEGAAGFAAVEEHSVAVAAMNFLVEDDGGGWTRLSTETRVHATDARARRFFRFYWRAIQPGSALIRRMWLRAIKTRAEGGAA